MANKLNSLVAKGIPYNQQIKDAWLKEGARVLRSLAKDLGWAKEDYQVRTYAGGIAVAGEATLHTKSLYIHVFEDGDKANVLVRSVTGMKDYSGGPNKYIASDALYSKDVFEAAVKRVGLESSLEAMVAVRPTPKPVSNAFRM